MAFERVQNTTGTQVINRMSCSVPFESPNGAGNLLVAVIGRFCTTPNPGGIEGTPDNNGSAPTIGIVNDSDGANKWKQIAEATTSFYVDFSPIPVVSPQGQVWPPSIQTFTPQGVDIWICENAVSSESPITVTAALLDFPLLDTHSPYDESWTLQMVVLEYSGATGYQLVDAFGTATQASGGSTFTCSSAYSTSQGKDLLIAAMVGDMTSATDHPEGWSSPLSTQPSAGFYVGDLILTTDETEVVSATWNGIEDTSAQAGVIVAFRQTGVPASSAHILQSSYEEQYIIGNRKTQVMPTDPSPGNTLLMVLYNDHGYISPYTLSDSSANVWEQVDGASLDGSRLGWQLWICQSAVGGETQVTFTSLPTTAKIQSVLIELGGTPQVLEVDQYKSISFDDSSTQSTPNSVPAGSIGVTWAADLVQFLNTCGEGWQDLFSDTAGVGFGQIYPDTPSGVLTTSIGHEGDWHWGGFLFTLKQQMAANPGFGLH